jgi:nucleoid-associated protein YgaU/DNA-binding SARP family transcriptional activator
MTPSGSVTSPIATVLRGISALIGLTGMLIGYPTAMIELGPRLPARLPSPAEIATAVWTPDDGTLFLATLAVIAWMAWAVFVLAVIVEVVALAARLATPRLPFLGWPQALAASLIAAITVMLLPVSRTAAAPPRPDIIATAVHTTPHPADQSPERPGPTDQPHPATPTPALAASTPTMEITVRDGDTLWELAAHHLGDGRRFADIAALNYHRPQPDGHALTDSHWLRPGWRLIIPDESPHPQSAVLSRTYTVKPHDTLWGIAARHLGDPERYREIVALNLHHPQLDGHALTDPDVLRPGWVLRLPATPTPDPDPPTRKPPTTREPPTRKSPMPTPPASEPPTRSPTTPDPSAARQDESPPTSSPEPSTSGAEPTAGPTHVTSDEPIHTTSKDGIHLNDSYLPWALASAITAAIALVWLHRRRRHLPGSLDDDPTDLPDPLLTIHRDTLANPDHRPDADLATRAADVPPQPTPPPGGLGLTGDGAPAAARAAIVTALASGGPREPDHRAEVITDRTTLTTLLGPPSIDLLPSPRLHITPTPTDALDLLEAQLLHRARILDSNNAPDLVTLRHETPDAPPLPPLLLIAPAPGNGCRTRTLHALAQGTPMNITALFLGPWNDGITLHIDPHGRTASTSDDTTAPTEDDTIAVLDPETTLDILTTLSEAHTGHRHPHDTTAPSRTAPSQTASTAPTTQPTSTGKDSTKAHLRVFGTPEITNITGPGKPLRAKAVELAVFLACHPDGVDTRTIGEYLEPDSRIRQADQHVYTNISNLRHVLARAAGPDKTYVLKESGRYRLDPTTVDVDLWTMRHLLADAATHTDPDTRQDLLRHACALYTAPLAATRAYDWIEPHQEALRQQATDAHLHLADLLAGTNPHDAADILDHAITLDPYNENLYQQAMKIRYQLNDRNAIHHLHRRLTTALAELDTHPDESTTALIDELLGSAPPSPDNP